MSLPVAALALVDFALIGLLPLIFFKRDGRFNLLWIATAAPFYIAPVAILLNLEVLDISTPFSFGLADERLVLETVATPLYAMSIATIAWTIGSHRVSIALWHQDNDTPVQIVTHGPYAWVRHPFYSAFLLAFLATAIACAGWTSFACLVYAAIVLSATARREERRLSASAFGADYRTYMQSTGRLVPGIGRAR
jgi:protein-S-isoprenylcysteine O-methyltransferase Ste14